MTTGFRLRLTRALRLTLTTAMLMASVNALALVATELNDTRELVSGADSITDQRYHYQLAKQALAKGHMADFEQHYALTGDYVLKPYLDYSLLTRQLADDPRQDVDRFLKRHANSFLATRLRQQWLYTLALQRDWESFLSYYRQDLGMTELECYQRYARLETGDDSALAEVADIWVSGRSLPSACDPLFARWRKAGGITDEVAWARFKLAKDAGRSSLARYVMRYMSDQYKGYAELYLKVHGYPYSMRSHSLFREQSAPMRDIIAHGIQRYARHNPVDAKRQWDRYEAQQLFDPALARETKVFVVKRLAWRGHADVAEQWIAQSSDLRDADALETLLREALKKQEWAKVREWIALLDDETRNDDRWQYWLARAQDELGEAQTAAQPSVEIYSTLATRRSFYGFMSADKLGTEYSLQHTPLQIDQNAQARVNALPAVQRAHELLLTDNLREATAEWRYATRNMDADEMVAAADMARRWGWHEQAIKGMIQSRQWNLLDLRFPLAYREEIARVASRTELEPTLIFAVARQESAFAERARSGVGARGLMQLMPGTARQTARRSGIPYSSTDELYQAENNILLGSHYLSELLEKYDGNRIFAAAAYNAGPHRVSRWMREHSEGAPLDVWIETIPFHETRGYVQNILSFSLIYSYRMGKSTSLFTPVEQNL